jgi:hypothetical protein
VSGERELDDDALLALVAEVLDIVESVPDEVVVAARAAFSLRAFDLELWELVHDSLAQELVGVRGDEAEARLLSFVNERISMDVELVAGSSTVIGHVTPPTVAVVEIEADDAARTVTVATVDELGRFRAAIGHGTFRFRVVGDLVTPWITRG